MSILELNSSVQFIIENHHLLTDEHMEMLDKLWHLKYQTQSEEHDCYICSDIPTDIEPVLEAQLQVPEVPQNQLVQVQAQLQAQPQAQPQEKKPRPAYNHPRWPSPIPKLFVQYIRGNNAWNYSYTRKTAWTSDFKSEWQLAGNTEFKLTHENCLRYLAYKMGLLKTEELMEKAPHDVHAKLIGPHHGVPGYYTKRFH
jgi:hypothetical protein